MKPIPNLDLPREYGEGYSATPIDLPRLLSVSIDELEIELEANRKLRAEGIVNLGKLTTLSRNQVAAIIGEGDALLSLDTEIEEIGLTFEMSYSSSLLTEEEYHIP